MLKYHRTQRERNISKPKGSEASAAGRKIHCYAAGFHQELASDVILEHSTADDLIVDPFVGSGTSLMVSRLLGRRSIGIDIDPVACLISKVITRKYSANELSYLEDYVNNCIRHIASSYAAANIQIEDVKAGSRVALNGYVAELPDIDGINYWFSPCQRLVVSMLRESAYRLESNHNRDVLFLAISSAIIRKWPNTISQAMDIDHSRPHRVSRRGLTVQTELNKFQTHFTSLLRVLKSNSQLYSEAKHAARIIESDVINGIRRLDPDSIDLILTSPPYFNAIDYPRAHKFSEWWLWPEAFKCVANNYVGLRGGQALDDSQSIPGNISARISWLSKISPRAHGRLRRYIGDMDAVIKELAIVLKPNKKCVFVVANNQLMGREIPVAQILKALFLVNGFRSASYKGRTFDNVRRRYPYGFVGPMQHEYFVTAQK